MMLSPRKLLLFALTATTLLFCTETQFDFGKKSVKLHKVGECSDQRHLPFTCHGIKIIKDQRGRDKMYSVEVTSRIRINKLSILITIWRCSNSENFDSCEVFLKDFNATDVCSLMKSSNDVWSDALQHSNLPKSCPIEPGNYFVRNASVSSDFLRVLPVPVAFYKMKFLGYDSGKKIACVDVRLTIIRDQVL